MTPTRITVLICLLRRPRHPAGLPEQDGFVWAASAAAVVLFAAGSAFVLLPRGGPDTADEGGWESSGDPADTTQPSLSSEVNTAPITTPGDPRCYDHHDAGMGPTHGRL